MEDSKMAVRAFERARNYGCDGFFYDQELKGWPASAFTPS